MEENTFEKRTDAAPIGSLRLIDAIVLILGIVIGAGIFRTPQVVAIHSPNEYWFLGIWVVGGLLSLIGALCYAELSAAFPSTGGDYHFLKMAFGKRFSFLYAWARVTVIQTGSIALLAFIAGDYLSWLFHSAIFSSAHYATVVVLLFTFINVLGIRFGTGTQKLLTVLQLTGILIIIGAGLFVEPDINPAQAEMAVTDASATTTSLNQALIFVLLTFGGWNEAAYVSSELKTGPGKMAMVMIVSILLITLIYLLINFSFLNVLGLQGIGASDAVGADMMRQTLGEKGGALMGILITLSALTSLNTTIFTGSRSNYAWGKDFAPLSFLGKWNTEKSAPVNALLLQGAIAILLIGFGANRRNGFETMVNFTAPVFWFFFLCTGLSVMVLRFKKQDMPRPFKVPIYPVTPILFTGSCLYMLYASLTATGNGALLGVALLLAGWIFSFCHHGS